MRRAAFALLVVLLAVAAWFVARGGAPDGRRRAGAASRVPGVVVLCLDTLRGDAIDPAPDGAGLPSLVDFAKTATRFDGALAPCSWTGPSIATVVSGLEPWHHGVLEMSDATRLAASVPTLASMLAQAGWSTAAITGGGWLGGGGGIPAGFETYAEDFDEHPPGETIARWGARRPLDRPFFLFLHTYAPHDPYGDKTAAREDRCAPGTAAKADTLVTAMRAATDPAAVDALRPAYVRTRYADPCVRGQAMRALGRPVFDAFVDRCWGWLDGDWRDDPAGPAVVADLRRAYLGAGLDYVDARLRATLAALEALPPGTTVVVLSDHGEGFGEHGALYHARFLYPELVRVALLVRAPGFPAGARIGGCCGLVDVAPTILELAGVAAPRPLDGRSLAGLVRDGGPGHPIASVVVPRPGLVRPDDPWIVRATVRDARATWSAVYDVGGAAWRDEAWYDRAADPDEHAPRASPPAPGPSADLAAEVARTRAAVNATYLRAGTPGR